MKIETTADIARWREQIDGIDRQLVELLNRRARAAQAIGDLKRDTQMPVCEPERERIIGENVCRANEGPLRDDDLKLIYERIIQVMRELQTRD